jgi:hypothetical protein
VIHSLTQLTDLWLEFLGSDFYRSMQIDQFEGQNKSQAVALPHKNSLSPPHRAALDPDSLADDKVGVGLDPAAAEAGAERLYL